nr:bifunctional diaminohydroxyphosphoribosylaminopyrimidine deaminase/5-amino-6-(5-phosphoribosylamino)uracil reductase RibD [Thiomicrorhabdus aquaedulcis]
MNLALSLAQRGAYSTKPNPAVGCVLVNNGQVVGQGSHVKAGEPHAERLALAAAGDAAQGATAYVTLEPCAHFGRTPPCATGLVEAGVAKVVVAMLDPNPLVAGKGVHILQQAGIAVHVGLGAAQAEALNLGFLKRMQHQLPYVRVKLAASLDGRTAMANGESQWITGEASRLEVHKMRAFAGALITGVNTVLADNPSLNVRLPEQTLHALNLTPDSAQPLRVVLDSALRTPLNAKLLSLPGRTLIMTTHAALLQQPQVALHLQQAGCEVVAIACDARDEHEGAPAGRLNLHAVLRYLAKAEHINDVLVEAGAVLSGAFVQAGLVDELHCFMAPSLLGDAAKPLMVLPGLVKMAQKIQLSFDSVNQIGEDIHLVLKPVANQTVCN